MINKTHYQALRFEERYGDGSIIEVIYRLNNGDTLKAIASDLSKKHPISVPQLMRYVRTFSECIHCPSDVVVRFYFVKQKDNELESSKLLVNAVKATVEDMKVIRVNFSPNLRTA